MGTPFVKFIFIARTQDTMSFYSFEKPSDKIHYMMSMIFFLDAFGTSAPSSGCPPDLFGRPKFSPLTCIRSIKHPLDPPASVPRPPLLRIHWKDHWLVLQWENTVKIVIWWRGKLEIASEKYQKPINQRIGHKYAQEEHRLRTNPLSDFPPAIVSSFKYFRFYFKACIYSLHNGDSTDLFAKSGCSQNLLKWPCIGPKC